MPSIEIPFIIDIEASGFGSNSYPIEVGVVLDNDSKFCSLIIPPEGWTHWDKEAEQIHHISRSTLQRHGKSVQTVADKLNQCFAGMTLYSDGWVVDKPWLSKLFYAAGRQMEFHVSPLEMILSEAQMQIWHDIKDKVTAEMKIPRHRASADAIIIQETYRRTLAIVKANAA